MIDRISNETYFVRADVNYDPIIGSELFIEFCSHFEKTREYVF